MSTSQATQATEAIDTPITTAQFLKNWTAGRYRNPIDWGTVAAGTRVTAELQLFDKRGKPTGKYQPVSLLITDLTTKNVAITNSPLATSGPVSATFPTTDSIVQTSVVSVPGSNTKVFGGPPIGKTNWTRLIIQHGGTVGIEPSLYILPDASAAIGTSTIFLLPPAYLPYSGAPTPIYPYLVLDNFGSSIWAKAAAASTSTATIVGLGYA